MKIVRHNDIFIGNHIRKDKEEKLRELEDENIRVLVKERPLQALTLRSQEGIRSLRQSTDDLALDGYVELAKELEQIPDLANIFVATSSGTTAQALAQYFSSKKISINIVQTSSCHPISDALQSYDGSDEDSIASAIVDHSAHRKTTLAPLIKKSGGTGFVASNDEILTAINMANKFANIDISPNGALSLAGLMKAIYSGVDINGSTVCIISGQ